MADIRIFSYLPNPRIWKATIAARLCGVEVEVRGASAAELRDWLWDFDAKPIAGLESAILAAVERTGRIGFKDSKLYKTDAFLDAHPFGTVPAAFSSDGLTGIFESNSIMRAVARLGADRFPLYGRDPYEASRIDSFLDVSLVFARDAQTYLFAMRDGSVSRETYDRATEALAIYLSGLERALGDGRYLAGDVLTLADICFACEIALFSTERSHASALTSQGLTPILSDETKSRFPAAFAHFRRLTTHPAFAPDVAPYLAKLQATA
jgi:glutathione S-transferase